MALTMDYDTLPMEKLMEKFPSLKENQLIVGILNRAGAPKGLVAYSQKARVLLTFTKAHVNTQTLKTRFLQNSTLLKEWSYNIFLEFMHLDYEQFTKPDVPEDSSELEKEFGFLFSQFPDIRYRTWADSKKTTDIPVERSGLRLDLPRNHNPSIVVKIDFRIFRLTLGIMFSDDIDFLKLFLLLTSSFSLQTMDDPNVNDLKYANLEDYNKVLLAIGELHDSGTMALFIPKVTTKLPYLLQN